MIEHLAGANDGDAALSQLPGELICLLRGGMRTILRRDDVNRVRVLIDGRRASSTKPFTSELANTSFMAWCWLNK